MMKMSFSRDMDFKVGQAEILTYRYLDGFKTGIEKVRLVSIGNNWYRFLKCLSSPNFSISTCEKFKIYAQVCRFMSKLSINVDGGQCVKTLIADAGKYGC